VRAAPLADLEFPDPRVQKALMAMLDHKDLTDKMAVMVLLDLMAVLARKV
jgi:hypothetical protein